MKKTHPILILLSLMAIALAISCAATPPPASVAPTEEASPPPATTTPPVAPPPAPPPLSPEDAFKAQTGMTPAEYYAQKEKELNAAREAAINAGAEQLAPEYLWDADGVGLDALAKWEAKDYFAAKDAAEDALAAYVALKDGLEAYKLREEIAADAGRLFPEYLSVADNVGLDALEKWDAKDYSGAKDGAAEALVMYTALKDGLAAYMIREEIAAKAERLVPEYLFEADSVGLDALDKWDAGDYTGAKDAVADALVMYSALKAGIRAYEVREEIAGSAGTSTLFLQADSISLDALDKWDSKDYSGAKAAAETALAMYLNVAASGERQKALDYRADVAVRQGFSSADAIYSRAIAEYRGQRYEEAAKLFDESWAMFKVAAQEALEKRQAAEEALRRSDQRLTESDETARQAELILEGGR